MRKLVLAVAVAATVAGLGGAGTQNWPTAAQAQQRVPATADLVVFNGKVVTVDSHSGTYAIDVLQKTLTLRIEQSSLPNWGGTTQTGTIKFLVGDDLGWTNPKALTPSSDFTATELIWRRAK